jgi:uncharacterized protein HemY
MIDRRTLLLAAATAPLAAAPAEAATPTTSGAPKAARLLREGRFPEAERAYRRALEARPGDVDAMAGLGVLATLRNRFADAEKLLTQVVDLRPRHVTALENLVEVAYRQDDFPEAGRWLRKLAAATTGKARQEALHRAKAMEAFGDLRPYEFDLGGQERRVPFVVTDPLPIIQVTLNDTLTVPMFLDTGGHDLYLDRGSPRSSASRRPSPARWPAPAAVPPPGGRAASTPSAWATCASATSP